MKYVDKEEIDSALSKISEDAQALYFRFITFFDNFGRQPDNKHLLEHLTPEWSDDRRQKALKELITVELFNIVGFERKSNA